MAGRFVRLVPNVLSIARLVLAAAFWALPAPWRLPAVIAGGFSDALDGFIARRFNVMSVAGGLLDGIADKAFTLSVLITLGADGTIAWWQVLVLLSRDLTVGGLALYAACLGRFDAFSRMVPKGLGKITTLAVFTWFVVVLLPCPPGITRVAFWIAGGASMLAGLDYFVTFLRRPVTLRGRRGLGADGAGRD